MPNVKVEAQRYDDGRISRLKLYPRKREYRFIYDSDKQVRGLEVKGAAPSLNEVVALIRYAQGDRQKQPVILNNVWDVSPSFVVNAGFEDNLVGWTTSGTVTIDTVEHYEGSQSAQFEALMATAYQDLPIYLDLSYVRAISVRIKTDNVNNVLSGICVYSDDSRTTTALVLAGIGAWEVHTINFSRDKLLKQFILQKGLDATANCFADDIKFHI